MSDTLTEPRFVRVLGQENAPACFRPGWLPDSDVFPELTEARSHVERLREAWSAAGARRTDLEGQIERDKTRRDLALRDSYLADEQAQLEPESEELKAALVEANAHVQAAVSAYLEAINRAVGLVVEKRAEWLGSITAYQESVDAEVAELLARAEQLRAERGNFARLTHWVDRTGGAAAQWPADHFPYVEIAIPLSGDVATDERRSEAAMLASYGGGLAPAPPISDAEHAALRQRNAEPQTPEHAVDLAALEDDELVDWLKSCGRFDSKPVPVGSLVVAAAEGDAAFAERLLAAEHTTNPEAPRPEVVDGLTQIIRNGKAVV